ncbi:hypothetical protein SDC9_96914 [bioreactor metagenome]|uniref:Uncharacterized protein n=1 Tax=bioreactor metagenome TaxID=1076179 RepID=A0A645ABV2_9ZZZZ
MQRSGREVDRRVGVHVRIVQHHVHRRGVILIYVRNVLHGSRVVVDRVNRNGHQRLRLGLTVVAIILEGIRSVEVLVGIVSNNVVGDRNRPVRGLEQIRFRDGSAQHLCGRACVESFGLIRVLIVREHRNRNRLVLVDLRYVVHGAWRIVDLGHRQRNLRPRGQARLVRYGVVDAVRAVEVFRRRVVNLRAVDRERAMRRTVARSNGNGDRVVVGHDIHVVIQRGNVNRLCGVLRSCRGGGLRGGRVVDRRNVDHERDIGRFGVAVRHAQHDRRRPVLVQLRIDGHCPVSVRALRDAHAAAVHERGVGAADERYAQKRRIRLHVRNHHGARAVVGILRQAHVRWRCCKHRQVVDACNVDFVYAVRCSAEFVLHGVRNRRLSKPVLRWGKGNRVSNVRDRATA